MGKENNSKFLEVNKKKIIDYYLGLISKSNDELTEEDRLICERLASLQILIHNYEQMIDKFANPDPFEPSELKDKNNAVTLLIKLNADYRKWLDKLVRHKKAGKDDLGKAFSELPTLVYQKKHMTGSSPLK